MAKYARVQPPPPPKRVIDGAFLLGALSLAVSVGAGVLIALYPNAHWFLWGLLALSAGAFLGLTAYYILERRPPAKARPILAASLAVTLAGFCATEWIGDLIERGGSPTFNSSPVKHGSQKVALYGSEKTPSLIPGGENVYRSSVQCTTVGFDQAAGPAGPWAHVARGQTCTVFIVWQHPIPRAQYALRLDGSPVPLQPGTEVSPYIGIITLQGAPVTGLLEVTADTPKD